MGVTATADSASNAGTRGAVKIAGFGVLLTISGGGMLVRAMTR